MTDDASTPDDGIALTLLMPCLDEAETLGVCLLKAIGAVTTLGLRAEVLVADNGSTDGSVEIAERLGARVVHVAEPGYGAALRAGIAAARGRWVIMGDCDDSYDWLAVPDLVEELRAGHDLVMGNRFAGGIATGAMPPLHRWLGNPVLSAILRWIYHSPCGDAYCGLRGFRRDAILALDLRASGWEFALEMVAKASLAGLSYAEVPVTLSPDGRDRRPHLATWRAGWASLRFLTLFGPWSVLMQPGLVLLGLAAGLAAWIVAAPEGLGQGRGLSLWLGVTAVLALLGQQAASLGRYGQDLLETLGRHPRRRRPGAARGWTLVLPALAFVLGAACLGQVVSAWDGLGLEGLGATRGGRLLLLGSLGLPLAAQSLLGLLRRALLDVAHVDRDAPPPTPLQDDQRTLAQAWCPAEPLAGVFPPPSVPLVETDEERPARDTAPSLPAA